MSLNKSTRLYLGLIVCAALLIAPLFPVAAQTATPARSAEEIRSALVRAQLELGDDTTSVLSTVREMKLIYDAELASQLSASAPDTHLRVLEAFSMLEASAQTSEPASFAAARAQAWTAILAGSVRIVEQSLLNRDARTAREWLLVREFRTATRFSLPGADATLTIERFSRGELAIEDAILFVRADLLDTYQARLGEALRALREAEANRFAVRRAELAALAGGYFAILAPAYVEQRGAAAVSQAESAFNDLRIAALENTESGSALLAIDTALRGFRAAPLSPGEQARRAGQLLRFISLIPVEYERGVSTGRVIRDFEIQEAITFHEAAYAAFSDLIDLLPVQTVADASEQFDRIGVQLTQASQGSAAVDPAQVQASADKLTTLLADSMPADWLAGSAQADFDVIASLLDQIETAVRIGDYTLAESARLEAYAIMETGPEARLMILAPQLTPKIEALFWYGQGEQKGLAHLIKNQAPLNNIQASRTRLDTLLLEAENLLGRGTSPLAVATNAGVIVFREGMEAVVILASLLSSLRRPDERKYRKPMWLGALAAFAATLATWLLARGVLQSLARYGEKLEAIVSLIAVCVLLIIMNWFFHKVYWTNWIAQFHTRKRRLLSEEAGLALGLVTLGFTSIYREGFEVVIFLQALVLEAGIRVVMAGTTAGLVFVVLLGLLTFRMQVNLPYRKMLIVTGIMIGIVLLQISGKTVYSMQVVGWMPIHSIQAIEIPYWLGAWFGIFPTYEGLALQFLAAGFVLGSYFLAEFAQKSRRESASARTA